MIKLSIPDMSCGHCTGVINKTVKDLDAAAVVNFELATRTATVSTSADPDEVCDALAAAGYPAALLQH